MAPSDRIDFIGIGTGKAGTTWLADVLREHPDLFIPAKKELNYFQRYRSEDPGTANDNYERPIAWYHGFFEDAGSKLKGEITPAYLASENAAVDIHRYNPNVQLIAVLRDPAQKAFSQFLFRAQLGHVETGDFETAIAKNPDQLIAGSYFRHLSRYYDVFDRSQIKVMLYDDLLIDNKGFLREVYDFLGVREYFPSRIHRRSNPTKQSRIASLNRLIGSARLTLHRNNRSALLRFVRYSGIAAAAEAIRDRINVRRDLERPELPLALEKKLKEYYRADIEQLERLIDRDLSAWKSQPGSHDPIDS